MVKYYFATVFLMFVPAWCLAGAPLADRVPGDALVYVGWIGSQSMGPGFEGSHLKAVLDASSLSELFDTVVPQILTKIPAGAREPREMVRLISAIGGPMWRHPSAIYFGGMSWDNGGTPMPRIAVLCDAGAEADVLANALKRVIAQAGPGGPPILVRKYGTLVVMGLLPAAGMDQAFANPLADGLAQSANFKSALAQVQQDGALAAYVDVAGIVKLVDEGVTRVGDPQVAGAWPKVRDGLGLGSINQMISTAGFDGKDWMGQVYVSTSGKEGVASIFNGEPLTDAALSVVPQTANRFVAGHMDLGAMFQAVHSGVEKFDPDIAQQANQGLAMINAMLGFDIEKDLLDSFGDEWVMYTDRAVGGPGLLGTVIVNKLKDPEKNDTALTVLSQRANFIIAQAIGSDKPFTVEFRQSVADGMTIHYLAVPFLAPGWAVKDGNLYLGLYPQVISAASNVVASKAPSIQSSAAYQALLKRLGDHKPSSVSFLNLPETAGDGYEDLLAMSRLYLGAADIFGIHTPAMTLPPLDKIVEHLAPSGGVAWNDEAGWHYKSVEPFPGSEALAGTGSGATMIGPVALMSSILLPSMNRARETANRVKCGSNERQIGQAMLMYGNENKQKYPPDLGTLIKTEDITASVFVCPDGNSQVPPGMTPDQTADWVNVHADYVYLGSGFNTSSPADQIMLYEKPGAHSGQGMNLLYGDGHVEWQNTAQAMREIDAQQHKIHAGEGGGL